MSINARAIVFPASEQVEVREIHLAPCGPDELICETLYSFVSPGTELRILRGELESKDKFPVIPGYSWVGRVVEVGRNVRGWEAGEPVTGRNALPVEGCNSLWGGQASHHRVEPGGHDRRVLKLPPDADLWRYIPVEVAAISWRGVSMAAPKTGESAVVVGQGLIGAFSARWLTLCGARVVAVDLEESRLRLARRWGLATVNASADDAAESVAALLSDGADIVVETSASMAGCRMAARLLKDPPPHRGVRGYPIARGYHWPRLVLQASYTDRMEMPPAGLVRGEGAVVLKPSDRTADDRLAVVDQVRRGHLPVQDYVDAPLAVEDAPRVYEELARRERLAAAFDWQE